MKKISKFDLGMIIAFVVVGLLGGGLWWWQSGLLATAQDGVRAAKANYDKYSTYHSAKQDILVNETNEKILGDNIQSIKAQLDPLIEAKLVPKDNKLSSIEKQDPVAWRHELDGEVSALTGAAKVHGVKLPPNFYFSFSRYLTKSPDDEQTVVLSKQLLAVEQIATILINAPVQSIQSIQRTFEEDAHSSGSNARGGPETAGTGTSETDRLSGFSVNAGGDTYTAYPFEIDFDTTTENLRKVMDDLVQSPYVLVVRSLSIQNEKSTSPQLNDLEKLAGPRNSSSVIESSPGEVAATTSTKGPQFLFGNSSLHVKARIDLIEWHAPASEATDKKTSTPAR